MICRQTRRADLLLLVWSCAAEPPLDDRLVGTWHAELDSPGGALRFTLKIFKQDGRLSAVAVNGAEEAPCGGSPIATA
jgi:hypothetical protein